jgi:WD40 repeat protein
VRTLEGLPDAVRRVAFSRDGKRLAASFWGWMAKNWDVETGRETATIRMSFFIAGLAFSPDGRRLALAGGQGIDWQAVLRIFDAQTGRPLFECPGHREQVFSVAFSPDGRRLASAGADNTVRLWDAADGKELRRFQGQNRWYTTVSFSSDGRRLAGAGNDGVVEVWEADRDQDVLTAEVGGFAASPAGLHAGSECYALRSLFGGVTLCRGPNGERRVALKGRTLGGTEPAFSLDGTRVALGFPDGTVRLWEAATEGLVREFTGLRWEAVAVALDRKGGRLAALGWPRTAGGARVPPTPRVWNTGTGQVVSTPEGDLDGITSLALSPDGRWLAGGSNKGPTLLWDVASGRCVHRLSTFADFRAMRSEVAFSPDGRLLAAVTGDAVVRVFEAESGHQRFLLEGHRRTVFHVVFSPDNLRLASAAIEGDTVKLWEMVTGQEVLSRAVPPDAADYLGFTNDGRRLLALGRQGTLRIWDASPPPIRADSGSEGPP